MADSKNASGHIFGNDDWELLNVPVNRASNDMPLYLEGYYTNARNGVSDIISGKGSRAALIFPVVSNFRQYLELRLKDLLALLEVFFEEGNGNLLIGHDLSRIWSRLQPLILRLYPEYPVEELATVEEVIGQFEKADPKAEAFRYPVGKSGQKSLSKTWDKVSLGALSRKVQAIHWSMGGIAFEVREKMRQNRLGKR